VFLGTGQENRRQKKEEDTKHPQKDEFWDLDLAGANKFMSSSGLENMKGATNCEGEYKKHRNKVRFGIEGPEKVVAA